MLNDPLYLQVQMNRSGSVKKKSLIEKEIERQIDQYISSQEIGSTNALLSGQHQLQKMRFEIEESLKLPKLNHQIETAVGILYSLRESYITKEAYEKLLSDLDVAASLLADLDSTKISETDLQTYTKISDESMQVIATIAITKFAQGAYFDCLALFSLLTILSPGVAEYWLRLGIAAFQCEDYDQASRAYSAAEELDPDLISAKLFAAECDVKLGEIDHAKAELDGAKTIAKSAPQDQQWLDFLSEIEDLVKDKR